MKIKNLSALVANGIPAEVEKYFLLRVRTDLGGFDLQFEDGKIVFKSDLTPDQAAQEFFDLLVAMLNKDYAKIETAFKGIIQR